MTRKRNDKHGTEFGGWLREQEDIDSSMGYVATNLDYIWSNYKTGKWLLIEEKRYMSNMSYSQKNLYETLHKAAKTDNNYVGFFFIQFENTNPDDGDIFINSRQATKQDLIDLLMFKNY